MSKTQILKLVQYLVGGSLGTDAEFYLEGRGEVDKKELCKVITEIYTLVHPAISNCNHKDWEEKWEKVYNALKKNRVI